MDKGLQGIFKDYKWAKGFFPRKTVSINFVLWAESHFSDAFALLPERFPVTQRKAETESARKVGENPWPTQASQEREMCFSGRYEEATPAYQELAITADNKTLKITHF